MKITQVGSTSNGSHFFANLISIKGGLSRFNRCMDCVHGIYDRLFVITINQLHLHNQLACVQHKSTCDTHSCVL